MTPQTERPMQPSSRRFEGRVAIVTGAASGIGSATARRLAAEGAAIVVADIDGAGAADVAAEIGATGASAIDLVVDVAEEEAISEMEAKTVERFGRIDVLHNNAGAVSAEMMAGDGDLRDLDVDRWDRAMSVNLRGVMLGCKHAVPHMLAQGQGAIVNTSSGSALSGHATRYAYGASKAGIIAFTKYVATAFGKDGIRANAVAPGLVLTPAARRNMSAQSLRIYEDNCLTPTLGAPEDVASMVAFLASEEASFVTGQVISVDGGALAHSPTYAQFREVSALVDQA